MRVIGNVANRFDISKTGYETIFKPFQEIVMNVIWKTGEKGITSGKAWIEANKVLLKMGKSKSRASVIFFLQDMVAAGYLTHTMATGKGGHHRVYTPLYNETEFKEEISKRIIEKLLETFPDETYSTMTKIMSDKSGAGKSEPQGHQGPQS